jgi:hypothetical protein
MMSRLSTLVVVTEMRWPVTDQESSVVVERAVDDPGRTSGSSRFPKRLEACRSVRVRRKERLKA